MRAAEELVRALAGEGPLHQAILAERARELAAVPDPPRAGEMLALLVLRGTAGQWALPLEAVRRVEALENLHPLPLPDQPAPALGLVLLAGCRCLLVDADAHLTGAPRRAAGRPGHAVLLRDHALALAVERADAIRHLPPAAPGGQVLADGSVLIDVMRLAAAFGGGDRT